MMADLKRCGCGAVPSRLLIDREPGKDKWLACAGNCCADWEITFRADFEAWDSPKCMERAIQAWNAAPRIEEPKTMNPIDPLATQTVAKLERRIASLQQTLQHITRLNSADFSVEDIHEIALAALKRI